MMTNNRLRHANARDRIRPVTHESYACRHTPSKGGSYENHRPGNDPDARQSVPAGRLRAFADGCGGSRADLKHGSGMAHDGRRHPRYQFASRRYLHYRARWPYVGDRSRAQPGARAHSPRPHGMARLDGKSVDVSGACGEDPRPRPADERLPVPVAGVAVNKKGRLRAPFARHMESGQPFTRISPSLTYTVTLGLVGTSAGAMRASGNASS